VIARVNVVQPAAGKMDEFLQQIQERRPGVRAMKGNKGGHVYIDRERGRVMTIQFWESAANAQQFDADNAARQLAAAAGNPPANPTPPEVWEVVYRD
jgi:heme-degrading monooxygenase HmoA